MEMIFHSEGAGILKIRIDRKKKKLEVALNQTGMKYQERPWTDLFDKGKEDLQERATRHLPDLLFKRVIIHHFELYDFTLMKDFG